MPRVVLHLGMPRTGSTSLQGIWTRHRDALRRLGIVYPELTPAHAPRRGLNHQHLADAMTGAAPAGTLDALLGLLERELRGEADTIILSYEMWSHRRPGAAGHARLLHLLRRAGWTIEPLAVVKSPAEAANSAYTLRVGFLAEHADFDRYLRTFRLRFRLDLPRRLLPWRAACGGMTALPLRDIADGAPLVERVWRAAGILDRAGHLLDAADRTRRRNASTGPVTVEAGRRLAATGLRKGQGDEAMRRITRAIEAAAQARGADAEAFRGYDTQGAAALEAAWAARNDRFAQAVWGRPWASRVAPPAPGPRNDLAHTNDPAGLGLVEEVLTEVCPGLGLPVPPPVRPGLFDALLRRLPL